MKQGVLFSLVCLLGFSSSVWAHTELVFPKPRFRDSADGVFRADGIKRPNFPCGNQITQLTRTNERTAFTKGSTIEVIVDETIEHTGHFAVYFSQSADDHITNTANPEYGALAQKLTANIADGATDIGLHRFNVTLPNVECTTCTLQVIQWMGGTAPYYSCADIRLVSDSSQAAPTPSDDELERGSHLEEDLINPDSAFDHGADSSPISCGMTKANKLSASLIITLLILIAAIFVLRRVNKTS